MRNGADVTGCHDFDDVTDVCGRCGALLYDAEQAPIGCEAGPEGNPAYYTGLALTCVEQAAGVTAEDKLLAVLGGLSDGHSLPRDEFLRRLRAFNERNHSRPAGDGR